jgi:hypothetical protein
MGLEDIAEIELLEEQIVQVKIYDSIELEEKHLNIIRRKNLELTGGKDVGFLVLGGDGTTISREAREIVASVEYSQKRIATAIVTTNLAHKIISNFYINSNKPKDPTKVFSCRDKATNWLKEQLKKHQDNFPSFSN